MKKHAEQPSSNQTLRDAGLKVTSPRVKVWDVLQNLDQQRHLSAEAIYQLIKNQDEDVNLATVYRILGQFTEAGLVIRHHFEGGHSVYEIDDGEHHDHLVCVQCGHVEEFVDDVIEEHQKAIANKAGFTITDHHLTIYGLCSGCRSV